MSAVNLAKHIATQRPPMRAPVVPQNVKGKPEQVKNNAGGFVFALDIWNRLDRFLILGVEGGGYYVGERALTIDNAKVVLECVKEDGIFTVNRIVEISEAGRAPKNEPALMALAICAAQGNDETRRYAMKVLSKVARIGTHMFHFVEYVNGIRGWGRLLKEGIANWYQSKTEAEVAFQAVKYFQRDGWSHRDLLRLSHPKADTELRNNTYRWIVKGREGMTENAVIPPVIIGAEMMKDVTNVQDAVTLINEYGLPREAVMTQYLNYPEVWDALMTTMKPQAMVRNLAKMTSIGLIAQGSKTTIQVVNALTNGAEIRKSRLHPISILIALKQYSLGHGFKGSLRWTAVPQVIQALNEAFYMAFGNVVPTGKRTLIGLDVSGSMSTHFAAGFENLTAREAATAMAMVTARSEQNWYAHGFSDTFVDLKDKIRPEYTLDQICKAVSNLPFARTDCAVPMLWAMKNNVEIDTFIIYTDNETYAGPVHVHTAMRQYREKMGIPAKLVAMATSATRYSVADPKDAGMLDVAGFDTAAPEIISGFSAGLF